MATDRLPLFLLVAAAVCASNSGCWSQAFETTVSTDPDRYDAYRGEIRTVSNGDWTLETWGAPGTYYTNSGISVGFDLKDRHDRDIAPKPEIHLKLRRANDGATIRESRPQVEFKRHKNAWRGGAHAFPHISDVSPGEYLLDIEIVLDDTKLTVTDGPVTIKRPGGGY